VAISLAAEQADRVGQLMRARRFAARYLYWMRRAATDVAAV